MQAIPILCEVTSQDFEAFFREQYPPLVRHAMRVLGNQSEAEEIAAEAFVKLLREKQAVQNQIGWLKRIALHLALDRLRSTQRRGRRELKAEAPPGRADPETDLAAAQQQAQVRRVLAALSQQDAALLLGRADGATYQELADLIDVRPTSIGTMLARAEKRFQQKFEEFYGKQ